MRYVERVRMYTKDMPLNEAVDKAVDECIECIAKNILRGFLLRNKAESIDDFTERKQQEI